MIYPQNLSASFEHKPKEYLLGAYGQILVIMPLIMAVVTGTDIAGVPWVPWHPLLKCKTVYTIYFSTVCLTFESLFFGLMY